MILYLASSNPGKLKEFREAASGRGIALKPVPDISSLPVCLEDGATFEENARKKALHYSQYCDGLVLADDSGICVDALAGAPGVYSARFAGPQATDQENNQKLLSRLRLLKDLKESPSPAIENGPWPAHYVCVIDLAEHGRVVKITEGRADGVIIETPRGNNGFGYDPFFLYPPLGQTFAELTPEHKFAVSHRGEAFRKLLDFLTTS